MNNFLFEETDLIDACLISPFYSGDKRGGFAKIFEQQVYKNAGFNFSLNEMFVSISSKNVIRGMHFQLNRPQAKIVSVLKGSVYDVIVDLRPDSITYKMWQGFDLNEMNHKALFVPRGFAHGFLALEDETCMLYLCDGQYDKETDTGIRFDDSEIGIVWPMKNMSTVICSQRDLNLMSFEEYQKTPMKL